MPIVNPSTFAPADNTLLGLLAASSGSSLVGFIQSGTGAVATDLQTRGRLVVYVTDFAPVGVDIGDGVVDALPYFHFARDRAGPLGTVMVPWPTVAYRLAGQLVLNQQGQRWVGMAGYIYANYTGGRIFCDYANTGANFVHFTSEGSMEHVLIDMNSKAGWAVGGTAIFKFQNATINRALNGIKMKSVSTVASVFIEGQQTVAGIKTVNDGSIGIQTDSDSFVHAVEVEVGFQYGAKITGSNVSVSNLNSDQNRIGVLFDNCSGRLSNIRANYNWDYNYQFGQGGATEGHIRGLQCVGMQGFFAGEDRTGGGVDNTTSRSMYLNVSGFFFRAKIVGFEAGTVLAAAAMHTKKALKTSGICTDVTFYDSFLSGVEDADALDLGHTGTLRFKDTQIKELSVDVDYLVKHYNDTTVRYAIAQASDGSTTTTINGATVRQSDTGGAVSYVVGASVQMGFVQTTQDRRTTAVGNIGAGTDTLMAATLAAGALNATSKGVRIVQQGTIANTAAAKTVKLSLFDATTGTIDVISQALTANVASTWRVECDILRTGSNAQDYAGIIFYEAPAGTWIAKPFNGTLTMVDSLNWAVSARAIGTNDNDIVQEYQLITFLN